MISESTIAPRTWPFSNTSPAGPTQRTLARRSSSRPSRGHPCAGEQRKRRWVSGRVKGKMAMDSPVSAIHRLNQSDCSTVDGIFIVRFYMYATVPGGTWACAALDRPNVGTSTWLARPCEGRKQARKEGGKERRCSRFLRVPAHQKLTSLRRRMATGMRSRVRARFTVCVSRLSVQRRLASPLPLWVYCLVSFRPLSSLRRLPYQVSS
jgi:hypothetical protein